MTVDYGSQRNTDRQLNEGFISAPNYCLKIEVNGRKVIVLKTLELQIKN